MSSFEIGDRVRRRNLSGELVEGRVVASVEEGERQMVVVLVDREDGRDALPREVAGLARTWTRSADA